MDYPAPAHAAYIWATGDELYLAFPPLPGKEKGHRVRFPLTEPGLRLAIRVLKDRATQAIQQRIATPAAPTQYQITNDRLYTGWIALNRLKKEQKQREKEEAEEFLKSIGWDDLP